MQWEAVVHKIAIDQKSCTICYTTDGSFEASVTASRINQSLDHEGGEEPSSPADHVHDAANTVEGADSPADEEAPITEPSVSGGAEIDTALQEPCLRTKKSVHKVNRALKSIMKVKCFAQ